EGDADAVIGHPLRALRQHIAARQAFERRTANHHGREQRGAEGARGRHDGPYLDIALAPFQTPIDNETRTRNLKPLATSHRLAPTKTARPEGGALDRHIKSARNLSEAR